MNATRTPRDRKGPVATTAERVRLALLWCCYLALLQFDAEASAVFAAGELLVQVHAAAVNPSDVKNVLGVFPHTTVPRTPVATAAAR